MLCDAALCVVKEVEVFLELIVESSFVIFFYNCFLYFVIFCYIYKCKVTN